MTPAQREAVIAHLSAGWKNVTGVSALKETYYLIMPIYELPQRQCEGYDHLPDDVLEKAFKLSLVEPPEKGVTNVEGFGGIEFDSWIYVERSTL